MFKDLLSKSKLYLLSKIIIEAAMEKHWAFSFVLK